MCCVPLPKAEPRASERPELRMRLLDLARSASFNLIFLRSLAGAVHFWQRAGFAQSSLCVACDLFLRFRFSAIPTAWPSPRRPPSGPTETSACEKAKEWCQALCLAPRSGGPGLGGPAVFWAGRYTHSQRVFLNRVWQFFQNFQVFTRARVAWEYRLV